MIDPEPAPPEVRPGDPITAGFLNAPLDAARRATLSADAASGVTVESTPLGTTIRGRVRLEMWARVTAAVSGSTYTIRQIEEAAAGTWVDGRRLVTARETSGNGSVPVDGTARVRAWKDRAGGSWWFTYRRCS